MITGGRAFAREHIVDTLHAILHDSPAELAAARPETPPALAAVVEKLLQKAPDARFASSRDVIEALATLDLTAEPAPWWLARPRLGRARSD